MPRLPDLVGYIGEPSDNFDEHMVSAQAERGRFLRHACGGAFEITGKEGARGGLRFGRLS